MPGAVMHFEIYTEEPAALVEFYGKLFGWRFERGPRPNYWRIDTGGRGRYAIAGGLTYRPVGGARSWVHYVHVTSLDDAVADAEWLGAVVLRPRAAVPKTAWYAVLADPEGNIFAIYQEDVAAFGPPETDT